MVGVNVRRCGRGITEEVATVCGVQTTGKKSAGTAAVDKKGAN